MLAHAKLWEGLGTSKYPAQLGSGFLGKACSKNPGSDGMKTGFGVPCSGVGNLNGGCELNLGNWGWGTVALDADQQRRDEGEVSRKEGGSALQTAAKGKRSGPEGSGMGD